MLRFTLGIVLLLTACGGRTGLVNDPPEDVDRPTPVPEVCNGLDDDLDGLIAAGAIDAGSIDGGLVDADVFVDEDFRDEEGRYVDPMHCGACNRPCAPRGAALEVTCGLVEESPTCVAVRCEEGFWPSSTGRCVPIYDRLCLACADDGDCGDLAEASCALVGGERRCTVSCALGCPLGYDCDADLDACVPLGRSCSCNPGDAFTLACALFDPEGERCAGSAVCTDGFLSECVAPDEVCDEVDNDCNGVIDDGFRDSRGAYSLDVHNCGECGVDCTLSTVPEGDLECGGDPFAPTCVLACPDAADGIQPGDRIDADRDIATGCECTVTSLTDAPGPVLAVGEALDVNCDGADGIVVQSFYVAPDGDDAGPGSPTRPLQTLQVAVMRAAESLSTMSPRPHVFVASGTYAESVEVPDGVLLHGGYRRDFLALDPDGFRVVVRAPVGSTAPGGAALVLRGAGVTETVLEWIEVRGLDATSPMAATFGIYALDPGPRLTLRDMSVFAGVPGDGMPGTDGAAGRDFDLPAMNGDPPRGAVEDASRRCTTGGANVVRGGQGGFNVCDGVDVSGGAGGSPTCPIFDALSPSGMPGRPAGAVSGGAGGTGGEASRGPIEVRGPGSSCPGPAVCCGLADFTVSPPFADPAPGEPGRPGGAGAAGRGCRDAFGAFMGDAWIGDAASGGSNGRAGSGGGGGGGGGGAVIDWVTGQCEFVDGLGGGGGGGGSGGCGGRSGTAGSSGAPSIAILLRGTGAASAPTLTNVQIAPADGGRGGDGGAGGAGGRGSAGGFGGEIPRPMRTTPTLAGPFPGGRGGPGGAGGDGGGGGGGCGGASVGVWALNVPVGAAAAQWRSDNTFVLGRPGLAGRGGGGAAPGGDGAEGGAIDVRVD